MVDEHRTDKSKLWKKNIGEVNEMKVRKEFKKKKNMRNKFPLNLNSSITSWMVRGSIRGKGKESFLQNIQTSCGSNPASYSGVEWILSLRIISI
jgi:hypothetical protein